jgi:hypothetical protein
MYRRVVLTWTYPDRAIGPRRALTAKIATALAILRGPARRLGPSGVNRAFDQFEFAVAARADIALVWKRDVIPERRSQQHVIVSAFEELIGARKRDAMVLVIHKSLIRIGYSYFSSFSGDSNEYLFE